MRRLALSFGLFLAVLTVPVSSAHAVYVHGYYRSNGTYVQGYERTAPDGNPFNNYDFPGNYNPNTGSITGGNPDTYLNDYYGYSGSYTGPSSYPVTPSCPLNSYYNGSSCSCFSGYVVDTNSITGDQACVSGYTKCNTLMGAGAQFNSSTNTCSCGYGYVQNNGRCESQISYCTDQLGLMSQYDSISQSCECMSGYEFDGSTCVYKQTDTYSATTDYSYPETAMNCPANSSPSLTDSTKCACNVGYQPDSTKTYCVLTPASAPVTQPSIGSTNCSAYGAGSVLVGNLCYCAAGYSWNNSITSCLVGNTVLTRYLTLGSTGAEVVALKNLLAVLKLYSGHVNTSFDQDTQTAVEAFQAAHSISITGTVGPQTRKVINGMMNFGQ